MTPFEVFQAALELATEQEQDAFVDSQSDAAVRTEVRSLLNALRRAGGFLGGSQSRSNRTNESAPASHSGRMSEPETEIALSRLKKLLGESPDPNAIGLLGHYSLQEILGIGGYGIVLRAFDEKLHRMVAVKILIPKPGTASAPHNRFLEEARSAAAIKHENVVQVHSVEESPIPYIVMEYIHGPTLHEFLNQEAPLETATLVSLSRQIASGLAASHDRGFVHRDIKPGNILVEKGDELRVKLTDFGLAQMVDDPGVSSSGDFIGTPSFTSPEQARSVEIDSRSDLFSLGSVMYQMACGHPPFRAKTTHDVLQRVLHDTPRPIQEIRPSVPDWFCQIVERLHAKNPEQRLQSASQLAKLLLDCEGDIDNAQSTVERSPLMYPNRSVDEGKLPFKNEARKQAISLSETKAGTPNQFGVRLSKINFYLLSIAATILLCGTLGWWAIGNLSFLRIESSSGSEDEVPDGAKPKIVPSREAKLPQREWPSLPPWSLPVEAPLPIAIPTTAEDAKERQLEWANYLEQPIQSPTSIGLVFALVPPGDFDKTFTRTRDGVIQPWMPTIRYRVTKPFRMATTEVTVEQFRRFVEETGYTTDAEKLGLGCNTGVDLEPYLTWNKPGWQVKPDEPVTMVTDSDARAFCEWLSKKESRPFRLPRESEWLHACRAGSDSRYVFGKDHTGLDLTAWTRENIGSSPSPVGKLASNPLGLYDMLGNVWERSLDWMEHHVMVPYMQRIDPKGVPISNTLGSCFLESRHLTHTDVIVGNWSTPAASIGFRVAEDMHASDLSEWKKTSLMLDTESAISPYALSSNPSKIKGLTSWSVCVAGMQSDYPATPVWNAKSKQWIVGGNDGGLTVLSKDGVFEEKLFGPSNRTEVKISPDGDWVVAKDSDGTSTQHLYVWYWPERRLKAILPTDDRGWSFSPDSTKIAFSKLNKGPWNNWGIYEFDLENGVTRSILIPRIVDAFAWHPAGDRVVCQTWSPQAALEVFEYPSMKQLSSVASNRTLEICVSPDGKRLAILDPSSHVIRIREFDTLKETQVITVPPECESVRCCWYADCDRLFIAGAKPPRVVSASTGEELFQIEPGEQFLNAPSLCEELGVLVGPSKSNRMSLFDAENGRRQGEWRSLNIPVDSVPIVSEGHVYIAAGNRVRTFGLEKQLSNVQDRSLLEGPWGVDSGRATLALMDRNELLQWNLDTNAKRSIPLPGLDNATLSRLVYSHDGRKIACVLMDAHDGTRVMIHDTESGEFICRLNHEKTEFDITSLEWSRDDRFIAILLQNASTELMVFDVSESGSKEISPSCVAKVSALANEPNTEHRLKFCRNGDAVVIAMRASFSEFDLKARALKIITTPRFPSRSRSVFVRPDDTQFMLTHGSQVHYFCDTEFGTLSSELRFPTSQVLWSADNATLFSHHPQFGFRIFDANTLNQKGALVPFLSDSHWIVCSPQGHYHGSEGIESLIAYVAMREDGSQKTYTPAEFAEQFGWRNNLESVSLTSSSLR